MKHKCVYINISRFSIIANETTAHQRPNDITHCIYCLSYDFKSEQNTYRAIKGPDKLNVQIPAIKISYKPINSFDRYAL